MKPVILLDVDGVLNAVCRGPAPDNEFDDFTEAMCLGFLITYSQEMGRRLAALDADIVWLTTWQERANEHIAPLFGWEEKPVVPDISKPSAEWWKNTSAQAFIEADPRPFIWVDDDLSCSIRTDSDIRWIENLGVPNLLISPTTNRGLRPKQIDMMEEFIASLPIEEVVPNV